ncbi:uncharacterized protein EV154DRAFT_484952 [Mucor mucedo]|uniref:uncharacterized protein n=1 Tax=Mucor mucedo TaxID=29922 RepID=UPI00221EC8B6|nr:uncharacterized protein EV154DRAFT_484952 [Mucor mucedo]KAI7887571.1 hypothetical protein EV154DRAFT_484952 [Mucor mucedo]
MKKAVESNVAFFFAKSRGFDCVTSTLYYVPHSPLTLWCESIALSDHLKVEFRRSVQSTNARGKEADKALNEVGENHTDYFYTPNIFSELHDIYLGTQNYNVHNNLTEQEAIHLLQQQVDIWKEKLHCSDGDLYFAFTTPGNWCHETRENFFRPLTMKANLIHKDDGQGRLIFLTELEATFRYIQTCKNRYRNETVFSKLGMKNGKEYIIYRISVRESEAIIVADVNLEIVSARYLALDSADSNYIPQSLKEATFSLPFIWKEAQSSLTSFMIKRYNIMLSSDVGRDSSIDIHRVFIVPVIPSLQEILDKEQCFLDEAQIHVIQSLSIGELLDNAFNSAKTLFFLQMDDILEGMNNAKERSMIILTVDNRNDSYRDQSAIINIFCIWVEKYKTYLKNSVKVYMTEYNFSFNVKLEEYALFDPIILPSNASKELPECSSKSVYLLNIDISPTQLRSAVTYFDENRLVKQINTIEWYLL